ncbi:tetratricopeptide repeat protein [Ursidibacter sp. B-7004-1]
MKYIREQNYDEAKKYVEMLCLLEPQEVEHHHKVAYIYFKKEQWEKAIELGLNALSLDDKYVPTLNLLSHCYGALRNWEKVTYYGHQALTYQDEAIPEPTEPIIPTPAPLNGKRIISFSLFGGLSKYIEPAILNTQVAPALFPNWICRFYVDNSVPENAIQRLKNNGAEIIKVSSHLEKWPGTMWRFLAINDPEAEYVIFRDTDSVICQRESVAVAEWIKSGKSFHTMRDSGSHTDLVLAGMWGAKAGSVPNIEEKIQEFIKQGYDPRFADQDFIKTKLWGYIRQDLWGHDRLFNFRDSHPFPELPFDSQYQIAFAEGVTIFSTNTFYEEGSKVKWTLYSSVSPMLNTDYSFITVPEFKVCSYETTVKNGKIEDNIPRRYGDAFRKGLARIEFEKIETV